MGTIYWISSQKQYSLLTDLERIIIMLLCQSEIVQREEKINADFGKWDNISIEYDCLLRLSIFFVSTL